MACLSSLDGQSRRTWLADVACLSNLDVSLDLACLSNLDQPRPGLSNLGLACLSNLGPTSGRPTSGPLYIARRSPPMIERLLEPVTAAQVLFTAMLAICFLQSGIDKVVDFKGNLA